MGSVRTRFIMNVSQSENVHASPHVRWVVYTRERWPTGMNLVTSVPKAAVSGLVVGKIKLEEQIKNALQV